jgi:hypothetical protein
MSKIRKGMWCLDEDGSIGIAHEDVTFGKDGNKLLDAKGQPIMEPTFHHVNEDGTTRLVEYRSWDGLRQALRVDIPASRRPDGEQAVRLGYA